MCVRGHWTATATKKDKIIQLIRVSSSSSNFALVRRMHVAALDGDVCFRAHIWIVTENTKQNSSLKMVGRGHLAYAREDELTNDELRTA